MGSWPREQQLLRVALAQINPVVGDIAGNARRIAEYTSVARDERRRPRRLPRADAERLSARGSAPEDELSRCRCGRARRARVADPRDRRAGRLPGACRGRLQRGGGARRRRGGGRLPQDVPAELRRVRRAALLPVRRRGRDLRAERHPDRDQYLRGHLGARSARHDGGTRRRPGDRQPVRLPLPRGLRPAPRAHVGATGGRLSGGGHLRQHGRRPGRARVRRAQPRDRPGRDGPHALRRSSRSRSASARSTRARWWPRGCATPGTAPTCVASGAPQRLPSRPCSRLRA